jgi:hypothetical protein
VRQILGLTQIDDAVEDNWLFAVDGPVAARAALAKHLCSKSSGPAVRILRATL